MSSEVPLSGNESKSSKLNGRCCWQSAPTSDAERGGDDGGWVYEELARDMTEAAMLVYNACLRGQQFADSQ
jgi:hypothetical protein